MRKNILITGASSGLGSGMARQFAGMGRNLALCARRLPALEDLREELLAINPDIQVHIRALDVCNHEQVFEVFRAFEQDLGRLDRIIINAGMGKGASLGTGKFHANLETAMTNFVAALAQAEAAMEIFRKQNEGHLVAISSVSAFRGFPGALNTYAATKAGLSNLAEGLRADLINSPIEVTTIHPGFILTDINKDMKKAPFRVDLETGSRALAEAIESEPAEASVPKWPWVPIGAAMKRMPLSMVAKMG